MSSLGSIPPNVSKLLDSATQKAQTDSQIAYAVAGKQKQAATQTGEAMVQLVEQALNIQTQLSQGYLDVHG